MKLCFILFAYVNFLVFQQWICILCNRQQQKSFYQLDLIWNLTALTLSLSWIFTSPHIILGLFTNHSLKGMSFQSSSSTGAPNKQSPSTLLCSLAVLKLQWARQSPVGSWLQTQTPRSYSRRSTLYVYGGDVEPGGPQTTFWEAPVPPITLWEWG